MKLIKVQKEKYNSNDNGKLNLEFRTIDTNNPFNRTPKSNWNDGSNKSDSSNSIISDYILNATNSYGVKTGETAKQTPKYTITLTPALVQDIRDYTHGIGDYEGNPHPYDEYLLNCEEDDHGNNVCRNAFLQEFNIIKVN